MNMTHDLRLLADNQPWNQLIFMAISVGLAANAVCVALVLVFGHGAMSAPQVSAALTEVKKEGMAMPSHSH